MKRYWNYVRMEQMRELLRRGRAEDALEIADAIDYRKIKDLTDLNTIAESYLEGGNLKKAQEVYLALYRRKNTRRVIMQLSNIAIKRKNLEDAEMFCKEFKRISTNDYYNNIYKYSVDKMKGESYEVLIKDLEELKENEYIEMWAYELAKLYHKAGMVDKCISECNDMKIWFGEGEYVRRAEALKMYYTGEITLDGEERASDSQSENAGVSDLDAELDAAAAKREEELRMPDFSPELAAQISYMMGDENPEAAQETATEAVENPEAAQETATEAVENPGTESVTTEDEPGEIAEEQKIYIADAEEASEYTAEEEIVEVLEDTQNNAVEAEQNSEVEATEVEQDSEVDTVESEQDSEAETVEVEQDSEAETVEVEQNSEAETIEVEQNSATETVDVEQDSEAETVDVEQNSATESKEEELDPDEALIYQLLKEEDEEDEASYFSAIEAALANTIEQTVSDTVDEPATENENENTDELIEFKPDEAAVEVEEAETVKEPVAVEDKEAESVEEVVAVEDKETETVEEAVAVETKEAETVEEAVAVEDKEAETVEEAVAVEEEAPATEDASDIKVMNSTDIVRTSIFDKRKQEVAERLKNNPNLDYFLRESRTSLEDYFGFFVYQRRMCDQIMRAFEVLFSPYNRNINMVVSGEKHSGKKGMIRGIAKILVQSRYLNNSKLAVTSAEKINNINLSENESKLIGGCLAIEKAGSLSDSTLDSIMELCENNPSEICVVLTDYRSELNQLFKTHIGLNSIFSNRIHIPTFDYDDLMDYAFYLLNDSKYDITAEAETVLSEELKTIFKTVHEGALGQVEKYVKKIIDRAEQRNAKNYIKHAMSRNIDSPEGNILELRVVELEDVK